MYVVFPSYVLKSNGCVWMCDFRKMRVNIRIHERLREATYRIGRYIYSGMYALMFEVGRQSMVHHGLR